MQLCPRQVHVRRSHPAKKREPNLNLWHSLCIPYFISLFFKEQSLPDQIKSEKQGRFRSGCVHTIVLRFTSRESETGWINYNCVKYFNFARAIECKLLISTNKFFLSSAHSQSTKYLISTVSITLKLNTFLWVLLVRKLMFTCLL